MTYTRRTLLALTRWVITPTVVLGLSSYVLAASPSSVNFDAARLDTYQQASGGNYFALSLTPEVEFAIASSHEIVIVFDTSASQTGIYREKSLDALRTMIAALDTADRVQLLAADVKAVPLTDGFVAPNSPAMQAALAALESRVPLGVTDMPLVLATAADKFGDKSSTPRSLVYIGDAVSVPGFEPEQFKTFVSNMADRQIAITGFAIGPRVDSAGVAVLANQTGGMLMVDGDQFAPQEFGTALAHAARSTVAWPTEVKWPATLTTVYPQRMLPLRSDRASVVVGQGALVQPETIRITVQVGGETKELTWTVKPVTASEDNAYLAQLVSTSAKDGGATLPAIGYEGLLEVRDMVVLSAQQLANLGTLASRAGDDQNATLLIEEALRLDPNNNNALLLKKAIHPLLQAEFAPAGDELRIVEQPATPNFVQEGTSDNFLHNYESEFQIRRQILVTEVDNGLNSARNQMTVDPASAEQNLKLLLERVRLAPELTDDVRAQLQRRLQTALQQTHRHVVENELREQAALQRAAEARDRVRVLDNLVRDQQRVQQLVERFNSLIDEGRYVEAEEVAAAEILAIDPSLPVGLNARSFAMTSGYHAHNQQLRHDKARNFMATLALVDKSSIPFPDEPPIVYPDAATWADLTRRREKYKSVDLRAPGSAEERISKELERPTQVEFIDTPLVDVIQELEDYHNIEIELNTRALQDDGLEANDITVTRSLKGVSLRSALRLILQEHDLTYIIANEVLLITTPTHAETNLLTKVYPVGDLVIPVTSGGGMGGGMMGGMMGGGMMGGGMMGGMGGMGGMGMGGMGMGGMGGRGMGGMGMGRGFMNVADDLILTPAKTAQPAANPTAASAPQAIAVEARPGQTAEQAWGDYFKQLKTPDAELEAQKYDQVTRQQRADVRETVRQMVAQGKYDEVVGLTRAALLHGHAQPWMYESMALAMQIANSTQPGKYPNEEIERVLLSAADFSSSPADLMLLAGLLVHQQMDEPALKLLKAVAAMDPTLPECYVLGLRLAQQTKDEAAVRWASLGILGQAWSAKHQYLVREAEIAAQAMLHRLKAENRLQEATEFEADLVNARVRDCLVRITWTGEADIDLIVKEPSGAICSLKSPRSLGGGVLVGRSAAGTNRQGVTVEEYIVPQGFSGTYKILLQQIWGNVATGKVTVDVYSHYGTDNETHVRQQLPIGDNDALIVHTLQNGRRQESLSDAQVANAAVKQVSLNRAVLAQQLNHITSSKVLASVAETRGGSPASSQQGNGVANLPYFPWTGARGAVGYQPQITTIDDGPSLFASAIISADRRYVRIMAMPSFTGIRDVFTYNTTTGATGQTQSGTNNGQGSGIGF